MVLVRILMSKSGFEDEVIVIVTRNTFWLRTENKKKNLLSYFAWCNIIMKLCSMYYYYVVVVLYS
jgi:hypothetical protein